MKYFVCTRESDAVSAGSKLVTTSAEEKLAVDKLSNLMIGLAGFVRASGVQSTEDLKGKVMPTKDSVSSADVNDQFLMCNCKKFWQTLVSRFRKNVNEKKGKILQLCAC